MYPNNNQNQPPVQPPVPPQEPRQEWGAPAPAPLAPPPSRVPVYQGPPRPVGPTGKSPFALIFNQWMKEHWKLTLLIALAIITLGLLIFQIVYPASRMLPSAKVDGVAVGWMKKSEAATKLDTIYGEQKLDIYFGKNQAAFQSPTIKEVGVSVLNEERLAAAEYPIYLRIIPGSIFFVGTGKLGDVAYSYDKQKIEAYTQSKVGDTCSIPAKDATLKLIDSQLQVVPSVPGGVCDITQFQQALAQVKPATAEGNKVRIDITETPAKVDDDKARELADMLNNRLRDPMPMTVDKETASIPGRVVLEWLDFKSDIPPETLTDSNVTAKLVFLINKVRMKAYIDANIASKLIKKPGVSKVSTRDFTETSRVNGANGRELDIDKAALSVESYINNKSTQALAATLDVGPTFIYTRTYTPTTVGFNALLAQFAQDNPGTYGLAFTELAGFKNLRVASYRADEKYKASGTEGLYLGYASLMEQSTGALRPVDIIAGDRNVSDCMKDMLEKSDEACREGFYKFFGHRQTTARGAELGLRFTTFAGKDTVTSASDLQRVIVGLYKGQIARQQGGSKILSTMRSSRFSDGIPKSVLVGDVSHIVGETSTVRNDAAAVYAQKGAYVLVVMSDGASWEKIAELTKKIQALRDVKMGPNDR